MSRSTEVAIDLALLQAAESLPAGHRARTKAPTPEAIELLRRFWRDKDKRELAKLLPCTDGTVGVHQNTARDWYHRHVEGANQ